MTDDAESARQTVFRALSHTAYVPGHRFCHVSIPFLPWQGKVGAEFVKDSKAERLRRLEDRLAKPMFILSLVFLAFLAIATYQVRMLEKSAGESPILNGVSLGLLLLWPVFLGEGVVRFFLGRSPQTPKTGWRSWVVDGFVALVPPARMGAHSKTRPHHMWLPWIGWGEIDFDLQKTLERAFSAPMLLIALMILPVLAIEYFWSQTIESRPLLRTALGISVSIIWMAFTIEFIIRCSAAEKKLSYAFSHWVDLAVVLLPTLEFLPFLRVLRVTRLTRLQHAARMARYYRLYGLAEKGWRGLVVLQLIQSFIRRSPTARLTRLHGRLQDAQQGIRELEREVDYYRRRIKAVEKERDDPRTAEGKGDADPPNRTD